MYYTLCHVLKGTTGYAVYGVHNANFFTFTGTWPTDGGALSGQSVEIYYSANGSATGMAHIDAADQVDFYTVGGVHFTHAATVALSDIFYDNSGITDPLNEEKIGVITFTFAKSVNAPAGINNVTTENFAALYSLALAGWISSPALRPITEPRCTLMAVKMAPARASRLRRKPPTASAAR